MVDEVRKDNRSAYRVIKVGSVVVELFEKIDPKSGKGFIDYRTGREFANAEGELTRGPYCQQRDIRDNIRALCDALEEISDYHRERRGGSFTDN